MFEDHKTVKNIGIDQNETICLICEEHKPEGLQIWGKYICSGCEARIVSIKADDDDYDRVKEQLKKLWVIN